MSGTLYLIPNRISPTAGSGSLAPDSIAAARSCRRFLAENARSARAFLKSISHPLPIAELEIIEIGHDPDLSLLTAWLEPVAAGADTAIVSESGCPAVADPGAVIVARAEAMGIRVRPMIGPCSILLTLMASGMNGQRFRFLGYLPIDNSDRTQALSELEAASRLGETQLFSDTPTRNNRLLESMTDVFSASTRITVAVDVTGQEESISTKTARQWKELLGTLPKLPTVFAVLAEPSASKSPHRSAARSALNQGRKAKKPHAIQSASGVGSARGKARSRSAS